MLQKVMKSAKLITLPEIYIQLKELLEDPDFTMAEVAILVGRDPAIATRFLRMVNSPLNRRVRNIESIGHAVSLLGINQIHDIVLCVSVAKTFEGLQSSIMDMEKFWRQTLRWLVADVPERISLQIVLIKDIRIIITRLGGKYG